MASSAEQEFDPNLYGTIACITDEKDISYTQIMAALSLKFLTISFVVRQNIGTD